MSARRHSYRTRPTTSFTRRTAEATRTTATRISARGLLENSPPFHGQQHRAPHRRVHGTEPREPINHATGLAKWTKVEQRKESPMKYLFAAAAVAAGVWLAKPAWADPFLFNTGSPDGLLGALSQPA